MASAWRTSRPPRVSSSRASSSFPESDVLSSSTGRNRASGPRPASSVPSTERASMRLRLPWMALISPLWQIVRNGWARSQVGSVLVEKRWWKIVKAVA